jgi:transcriptional regulator with XRE-family HTH domain
MSSVAVCDFGIDAIFSHVETSKYGSPWRLSFSHGTAGALDEKYVIARLKQGARFALPGLSQVVSIASDKDDLELLIEHLQPSMAQLASAFGVSRQAIYDWRAGKRMSVENRQRLTKLSAACARLNKVLGGFPPRVGERQLPGGQSFWELIASGIPPQDAAERLIILLKRETSERQIMRQASSLAFASIEPFSRPMFADKLDE